MTTSDTTNDHYSDPQNCSLSWFSWKTGILIKNEERRCMCSQKEARWCQQTPWDHAGEYTADGGGGVWVPGLVGGGVRPRVLKRDHPPGTTQWCPYSGIHYQTRVFGVLTVGFITKPGYLVSSRTSTMKPRDWRQNWRNCWFSWKSSEFLTFSWFSWKKVVNFWPFWQHWLDCDLFQERPKTPLFSKTDKTALFGVFHF